LLELNDAPLNLFSLAKIEVKASASEQGFGIDPSGLSQVAAKLRARLTQQNIFFAALKHELMGDHELGVSFFKIIGREITFNPPPDPESARPRCDRAVGDEPETLQTSTGRRLRPVPQNYLSSSPTSIQMSWPCVVERAKSPVHRARTASGSPQIRPVGVTKKIRPVKRPVWRGGHDCRRVAAPQVDNDSHSGGKALKSQGFGDRVPT